MKLRFLAFPLFLGVTLACSPLAALGLNEGSIQKTWDYPEGIRTLVIDADRQDVVLKSGGPGLSGRMVGDSGDILNVVRDGDTLTITARTDRSWFSWRHRAARIEVTLPPDLSLDVTTASGAALIEVSTSSLRVQSASGDIEAARGGLGADVSSASGTVRLKDFTGPINASIISGTLILEDVSGNIQASTMSGDIRGSGLAPSDKSRFTTVSGNADLKLKGGLESYTVRSETVSGEVSVGDATSQQSLSVGSGGSSLVVKSVSGNVRVK